MTVATASGDFIGAGVDCGSNSVHALVAVVRENVLHPLLDESTFLGLGSAARRGELGAALRGELAASVDGYLRAARRLGAREVAVVGTDPFRRAADAADAARDVEAATGHRFLVATPAEEAYLTLIGVTDGRRVGDSLCVCDIGGGSTELAFVARGSAPTAHPIHVGSAALTEKVVRHDPPTRTEMATLRREARRAVAAGRVPHAERYVGVGGSATNLVRVLPAAQLDRTLTRDRLETIVEMLAEEPAATAAERHGVSPTRARQLIAGAVILEAVLRAARRDHVEVSDAGIREGLVLVQSRGGGRWRSRLRAYASGWGPPA